MEENVLKDFETFSEFPDKYLKVSKNSSYYFIKKSGENFVAKRSLDSLSTVNIFNKDKSLITKAVEDAGIQKVIKKINANQLKEYMTYIDNQDDFDGLTNKEKIILICPFND